MFLLKKLYCYPPVSKATREVANFRKSKNDAPMLPVLSVSLRHTALMSRLSYLAGKGAERQIEKNQTYTTMHILKTTDNI